MGIWKPSLRPPPVPLSCDNVHYLIVKGDFPRRDEPQGKQRSLLILNRVIAEQFLASLSFQHRRRDQSWAHLLLCPSRLPVPVLAGGIVPSWKVFKQTQPVSVRAEGPETRQLAG